MGTLQSCLLILPILISHAGEYTTFNFTINSIYTPSPTSNGITSGHRTLDGLITIPDMFIKKSLQSDRRRLKEEPIPTPDPATIPTPAPTNKLILPVIVLIHPEGIQITHCLFIMLISISIFQIKISCIK